ncbi:MAG: SRPBCC domain-containing protein [Eudoraea sp.]|nr:SRPBCC domain-containing protein [Eudoraea sp.]
MKTELPIIVEATFDAKAEEVWKALTVHDLMIQWYFENIPAFEAREGFKTQFNVESNDRDFFHIWEVTLVVPGKKIGYSWRYANIPGEGHVEFELTELEGKTILKLTNTGLESFPQHIPEFKRESCIGGWNYFIRQRLKEFLEK